MQPQVVPSALTAGGLVLAVRATGQGRLRSALRRVAADPALLAVLTRVVVLDAGRTPSATVLREAVRLPPGRLRVVRRPDAGAPEVLARALAEAVGEPGAAAVLVLDDASLVEPAVLLDAFDRARHAAASDVVGLRDPAAIDPGPMSWWGAVLPLDAVRAIGAALPEANDGALAELVLRAASAGFRSTVLDAAGPVPDVAEVDRLLIALLHGPVGARTALLAAGIAQDLRLVLAFRHREVVLRSAALRVLLSGPERPRRGGGIALVAPRLRLWVAWPALRRRYRSGALARASAEEWALRFAGEGVNRGLPSGDRKTALGRPAGLRFPAWSTRRGTSAA
jgi:hypothetical protein